jgi:cGMP-dependent protein kinase
MGYIKIIDFGTVKEIKGSTNSVIGTPHYMAPEILKGGGYSFEVDMWSIAVCMYEFFCGKLPFGEDCDDPVDVYKAVAKQKLEFPKFVKDKEFMNLLTKMLIKNVKNRLYRFNDIKYDPYYKNFNWNKLISLAITPPYKVKFKKDNYHILSTYMDYLNNQNFPKLVKKKNSIKQQEFDKWFKNF